MPGLVTESLFELFEATLQVLCLSETTLLLRGADQNVETLQSHRAGAFVYLAVQDPANHGPYLSLKLHELGAAAFRLTALAGRTPASVGTVGIVGGAVVASGSS
jgi:hypothetical protein